MKINTPKDYAVALYELARSSSGSEIDKIIKNFVLLLVKSGDLKKSDRIINEFVRYEKKQKGIIEIELSTARPLNDKTLNAIKSAFGKHVEATEKIDPGLIGGIKIKTEDKIFDASIKKQLQMLKQSIS